MLGLFRLVMLGNRLLLQGSRDCRCVIDGLSESFLPSEQASFQKGIIHHLDM